MRGGSPEARAQLNLVESSSRGGSSSSGAWVDAAIRSGRVSHTFGGFYLDPDLVWGNQQLASDSAGGYYRAAFQNRRWTIDGGVDYMDSVSGSSDSVIYGTGYARYQYSSGLGVGGGANIRQSGSEAWSVFGFADMANRWGIGRGQANYAQDERQDYAQITLDQTWKTQVGRRLSTSIMAGRENLEAYSANTIGLALYGGGDLGHNLSVDVNARWDKTFGEASSDNTLANAAINWAFASGWTASANYYKNRRLRAGSAHGRFAAPRRGRVRPVELGRLRALPQRPLRLARGLAFRSARRHPGSRVGQRDRRPVPR